MKIYMLIRKKVELLTILLLLFLTIDYNVVSAYEFQNYNNESKVNDMIGEVYDAKQQYVDLAGEYVEDQRIIYDANNNHYWWPIGSKEVVTVGDKQYAKGDPETVNITSPYGYRKDPMTGKRVLHSGVDISGGAAAGVTNVIAAQSGTVVYPGKNSKIDCPSSNSLSSCGGGYGNYVIIQHVDGNYTLYGHLYANSITVRAGDGVEQGQVIGKMGSSGNSTGPHLHFEVREGQNSYSAAVDGLNYISVTNPRNTADLNSDNPDSDNLNGNESNTNDSDIFVKWLKNREGTKKNDKGYIVHNGGDVYHTVGYGMTLENNKGRFKKYGIDISKYDYGDIMPFDVVDKVFMDRLNEDLNAIKNELVKAGITNLKQNQIDALRSRRYNIGGIKDFVSKYKTYGDTDALKNNYFLSSDAQRRHIEWYMFHYNKYILKEDASKYGL